MQTSCARQYNKHWNNLVASVSLQTNKFVVAVLPGIGFLKSGDQWMRNAIEHYIRIPDYTFHIWMRSSRTISPKLFFDYCLNLMFHNSRISNPSMFFGGHFLNRLIAEYFSIFVDWWTRNIPAPGDSFERLMIHLLGVIDPDLCSKLSQIRGVWFLRDILHFRKWNLLTKWFENGTVTSKMVAYLELAETVQFIHSHAPAIVLLVLKNHFGYMFFFLCRLENASDIEETRASL